MSLFHLSSMDLTPLLSSFGIVALAEFGDKTQLATIALCSRHKPISVFAGALFAFTIVDGISVLIGEALAAFLPMSWIGGISGVALILFGIYTLLSKEAKEAGIKERRFPFASSFLIMALMELGDKTQLAVIALAAKYSAPVSVFLGVMLAFLVVVGIGVTAGAVLLKLVPMRYIRGGASAIFILFGILFLLGTITDIELLK